MKRYLKHMHILESVSKLCSFITVVANKIVTRIRNVAWSDGVEKAKDLKNTSLQLVKKDPEEWEKLRRNAQAFALTSGVNAVVAIDKSIHYIGSASNSKTDNEVLNAARAPLVFGIWVMIVLVGFFSLWACFAQLDSAAIAHGTVVVETSRKTIQHLEGGIIKELLVKDGDKVTPGQALLRLDDTNAKARVDLVMGQLFAAKVAESRLIAERDDKDTVEFSPEIEAQANDKVDLKKILDSQVKLFESRKASIKGQVNVLNQQMDQYQDVIVGLGAQVDSSVDQLKLINEEIAVVQKLLEKGNANKPRLLALQRQGALLSGNRGEYQAKIAQAKQEIAKAELEISNINAKFLSDVVNELKETQVSIADLEERNRAAQDVLARTTVTSPEEGIVTEVQFHTTGGVISPGAKIMDIIPQSEKLTIEARVSLQDIDVVHAGLKSRIRLVAFKSRETPVLEGVVKQVSADKIFDNITRESYYKAKIIVDEALFNRLNDKNIQLYPGMPVDVMIATGSRSFMGYLLSPITDTFNDAFREQ